MTIVRIGNKNYRIVANGQTLFATMEILLASDPSLFVSKDTTGTPGQFVTAIKGVEGPWVFKLNGQRIPDNVGVGISQHVPILGDRFEWGPKT